MPELLLAGPSNSIDVDGVGLDGSPSRLSLEQRADFDEPAFAEIAIGFSQFDYGHLAGPKRHRHDESCSHSRALRAGSPTSDDRFKDEPDPMIFRPERLTRVSPSRLELLDNRIWLRSSVFQQPVERTVRLTALEAGDA